MKTRRIWECYGCKKEFSLKVGTIMEDSPLRLDKWMMTAWMIAASKNEVSSYEIHSSIGVTQKSAWFMLHRLLEAMKDDGGFKLGGSEDGPVEMDETFVGGKGNNVHKSKIKQKFHGKSTQGRHGKSQHYGDLSQLSTNHQYAFRPANFRRLCDLRRSLLLIAGFLMHRKLSRGSRVGAVIATGRPLR